MAKSSTKKSHKLPILTYLLLAFLLVLSGSGVWLVYQVHQAQLKKIAVVTEDLATLESSTLGYRTVYPSLFEPILTNDGVQFTSPTQRGKIILKVESQIAQISIDSSGLNEEETQQLTMVANLIRDRVEFFQPIQYSKAEISKRFKS